MPPPSRATRPEGALDRAAGWEKARQEVDDNIPVRGQPNGQSPRGLFSMEQRITLLTLGVRDLAKSTAFLERLGWRRSVRGAEGASFFQCGSIALSLFPRSELAKDAGIPDDGAGFGGFSIAHNTRSKDEVDAVLAEARSAGAEVIKPARNAPWGGYAGYFRDLDGFLWEVAWNPDFPLDPAGAVQLPD